MKRIEKGKTYLLTCGSIKRKVTITYTEQYDNGTDYGECYLEFTVNPPDKYGSYGNYRPCDGKLKVEVI